MSDSKQPASDPAAVKIDWLLGELTAEESRDLQRGCVQNPDFARDTSELQNLFDDLRSLQPEPQSGDSRVALALRATIERRLGLRRPAPSVLSQVVFVRSLKVAAVAAVCLGVFLLGERWWVETGIWVGNSPVVVAQAPKPVRETVNSELPIEDASREERSATAWLIETNGLASLRREFKSRFNPSLRRRAIRAAGGNLGLEIRIGTLADEVAAKMGKDMMAAKGRDALPIQDVTLALRALLAAGSTKRMGPHQNMVRRCSDYLEQRVASLEGGELATALSGLMDVAVVYGGSLARLVETHTNRLVQRVTNPPQSTVEDRQTNPSLLSWNTPVSQLADAGQVLRQAAAFGVDAAGAVRVRSYVAQHLADRISQTKDERPDLLAAYLYGFGEFGERDRVEHKLRLWGARDLVPEHFVALHHVSWSRFPLRSGWADFQRDLRRVSAWDTPAGVADTSALLLCLAVNYAAPGCQELLDLVATR
jgi:anti-sigma-K factor RskA